MENKMKAKIETQMSTDAWNWFIARYTKMGYKSLNQFAIATGLQKSSLSRYFHRQRQMPSGMMAKMCQELKVTPNELMKALGEWK
jgi:transcriptional regulator with XRE-family HTH domain